MPSDYDDEEDNDVQS